MFYFNDFKKIIFIVFFVSFGFLANNVAANIGEAIKFNVDKGFDFNNRSEVIATLVKTNANFYFYVENQWWASQTESQKNETLTNLDDLSQEFASNIYPRLTSVFGKEWNPGVDGDSKITVLFHSMNSSEGGYFRTADEYVNLQVPDSNEREMLYLSLDEINSSNLKRLLAHEFVHLITFNQKNKKYKIEEETWLNEARADYSSEILGYDDEYSGSNLETRVRDFVANPSDSITEWSATKYDYASIAIFTRYLADHYGVNILMDSLDSEYVGIESINYALLKSGAKEKFDQIFTNWTIALALNNCSIDKKYCYLNENLRGLKITPSLNFVPITGNASLSVNDFLKSWTGRWLKFIGGSGDLELTFSSPTALTFKIPYIIEDKNGVQQVKFLILNSTSQGKITVENFSDEYRSIIIIPSLQTRTIGLDEIEPFYPFTYSIFTSGGEETEEQIIIQQLLQKISILKSEIAKLQNKNNISNTTNNSSLCLQITQNLYIGINHNNQVKCLQEFLKSQGGNIYPEGYITGNFGEFTKNAVIKFQEKYSSEILKPYGLLGGTGYVGEKTRQKINQLLSV